MGQSRSKVVKKKILRRRRPTLYELAQGKILTYQVEDQPPTGISVNISGRNYVLKDSHWVLDLTSEMRPLERDPKPPKMTDILTRENTSLRLKISRLVDMLHISQDIGRLSVLDKKIDNTVNASQDAKISTVKVQNDNIQLTPAGVRRPTLIQAPTSLPFKISDPDRISRRLEGIVFGLGQPLLDVVAKVTIEFLDSFELSEDEVHELGDHEMGLVSLLFEVFPVEYLTGGSAQNSIIMSQWLMAVPNATTFAGCIGKDNIGDILTKTLTEAGINIILRVQDNHETGLCIVFESSRGRRMALRVGAMRNSIRAALEQPQHRALLHKARCFYVEAYTLTYALEAALEVARYATEYDRYFCLNLTATHASLRPVQGVAELMPYVDVIFASDTDVREYAALLGVNGGQVVNGTEASTLDMEASAVGLSGWRKENGLKGRLVVVVRPSRDTVVVQEGKLATFPSMPPSPGCVVDDIGFGDAFAGAFMAVLVLGGSLDECLEAGGRAATFSLFERGCAPPRAQASEARRPSRRESVGM